ncbi:glycosyltransferase [Nodosilinea sp. LEGE 07088]|uniref:glycosyltransferase n=1 Tax=Nodosilinea sp. LEGE 07088 TaxID=2777968 RepID=UPI001881B6E4|nr:glycosyltransferase [Nodosilinea sp. LEGE 07088]MBE9140751.1 glycosyltransferase [Nodosilinea sp. LEGE 07088]
MAVPAVTTDSAQPQVHPSVTVIVPIYNGEADLPDLVERLLEQQYPADRVEYLLVDNGSRDRTPRLLQAATQTAVAQGIQLRALTYSTIQSSYAARNAGIVVATGDILAFTDADCHPEPGWLAALVQPFTDDAIGLVAGEIKALPSRNWLERYADRQGTLSQSNTLNHSFLPYGQTANLAVRAEILGTVGCFRPHLTTGGDADLCWRIQKETDWRLVHAPNAVVYHRHRNSLEGLHSQWYRYGCSNRYLHDLHGVELTRSLTLKETRYRLLRWGLKELPQATAKLLTGRGTALELAITPLDLWCARARSQGQAQAQLPDDARTIAHLGEPA